MPSLSSILSGKKARTKLFSLSFVVFLATGVAALDSNAQLSQSGIEIEPGHTFRNWTVSDGLPIESITGLHQDTNGYLWISTFSGLARFDGRKFELYQANEYPGLPNNRLVNLIPGPNGSLFLLSESREGAYFDGNQIVDLSATYGLGRISTIGRVGNSTLWIFGEHSVVEIDSSLNVKPLNFNLPNVYGTYQKADSTVLIGSSSGLYQFHPDSTVSRLDHSLGLPSQDIRSITEDKNGDLILATAVGVYQVSQQGTFPILAPKNDPIIREAFHLFGFGSEILVLTDVGWRTVEGNQLSRKFTKGTLPNLNTSIFTPSPAIDSEGNLWFAVNSNVYKNGELVLKTDDLIRYILPDKENGIWIGHSTRGLFKIDPSAALVWSRSTGLPGENVYGLFKDTRKSIWSGFLDASQFVELVDGKVAQAFPIVKPWAVGEDAQNTIWLGGEFLCRVVGNECIKQTEPPLSSTVRAIYTDSRGRFWVGSETEVWMKESPSAAWVDVSGGAYGDVWVRSIYEGIDGTIYLGLFGKGVGVFQNNEFELWNISNGFISNNVRSFFQHDSNTLWVGTEDKGLVRVSKNAANQVTQAPFAVFDTRSGLPDNAVHTILPDNKGRLWVNSNAGIYSFSEIDMLAYLEGKIPEVSFDLFDNRRGLLNREGNGGIQSAGFSDEQGRLHFPTQGGIVQLDPSRVRSIVPPKVFLENIRSTNRTIDLTDLTRIELFSDEVDLRISFAAPFFESPEHLRFRYRLNGYSDSWTDLGPESNLVITNMPPGTYELEIQSGISGNWNASPTILHIFRKPSFDETGWFIVLLIAFGMSTGIVILYGRTRMVKRRNDHLEQVVQERTATIQSQAERLSTLDKMKTRFFTNVSHELRTPLTLIKAPLSMILEENNGDVPEKTKNQLKMVDRSVERLQKLVNQILDLSALEAGKVDLRIQTLDFGNFLSGQIDSFRELARIRNIELQLQSPEGPLLWNFDAEKMEWVLANLLSNAIKFSNDEGKVLITAAVLPGNQLSISVRDFGAGIDPVDLPRVLDRFYQGTSEHFDVGSGIGLSILQEIVQLLKGQVTVESELQKGSCFTVTLPFLDVDETLGEDVEYRLKTNLNVAQTDDSNASDVTSSSGARPPSPTRLNNPAQSDARNVILIAEDNVDLLAFLRDSLSDTFDVITAENGNIALQECANTIPDLVITDVMMPELNGMEFCRRLKSDMATSHIPVLMLTASADTQTMASGLQLGADVYLTKPFETPRLMAYIQSLLDNRRRLREVYTRNISGPLSTIQAEVEPANLSLDEQFVVRLQHLIHEQISDSDFRVESLADQMHLSSRQFLRKVEALTGEIPSNLLRRIRLEKAGYMIAAGTHSIKEVASKVGFKSDSGFRKAFKQHFGVPPSQIQ